MLNKLKKIYHILKDTPNDGYYFKNISNSVITIIKRSNFKIDNNWFENLLSIHHDDEIKSKFIPELHQDNNFERQHLADILNFERRKNNYENQVKVCLDYINRFQDSYRDFYQYINIENISITDNKSIYVVQTNEVFNKIESYKRVLIKLGEIFKTKDYEILQYNSEIKPIVHGIPNILSFNRSNWQLFLDKEPIEEHVLRYLFQHHNQVYYSLNELNMMLNNYSVSVNHKIIAGKAGMGKSHMTAYLIEEIKKNNDLVIFLKPKYFNGDNINFEKRFLQLLHVPEGYTIEEILIELNEFSKLKKKRCFIIIDALNETTKSHIGFSNIWKISLQSFINQINSFSNIYFICTLRTSYIENIWDSIPNGLVEIKGFDKDDDIEKVCERYFKFYKIKPLNFKTADLSPFEVPLLLDLFCKLTNGNRLEVVEKSIDVNSYSKVFEDYINKLTREVKDKLNLQLSKPITDGFNESSSKFLENNEAELLTDDFSTSFDKNLLVKADESIARAVIEGYLIFIKDFVGKPNEIVKHTQQEVGGYLLAKKLVDDYPEADDLVNSKIFQEKIVSTNLAEQHQLRLDILKFLIALRPEIIEKLNDDDSLKLSWWFIFNKIDLNSKEHISENLIKSLQNDKIFDVFLDVSSNNWFNTDVKLNFEYVSNILYDFKLWDYDLKWTYFLYRKAQDLDLFIDECIEELNNKGYDTNIKSEIINARFVSYILSTTVRELRDKATSYLIKFGKLFPFELLELTVESSKYKDIYIYERLVNCCYGVMLIRQNDKDYLEFFLPKIAFDLFELQFSENPKAPKFNYIVIDSIKHLLDFVLLNDLIEFTDEQKLKISNYEFNPNSEWIPPTKEQQDLVDECYETSWPEPIGMDFGIYTIPRLVKGDDENRRIAIANVYKRVFELGFVNLNLNDLKNELFKEFIWGHKLYGIEGKVDKLGKKYNWNAFFDYAGYLLLNKRLNVYDRYGNGVYYYQRLSDVDIDISIPNKDYDENLKLFDENLLNKLGIDSKWYEEVKIDTVKHLFETKIDDNNFTMLYGFVEQRINEDYKVRSFLMIETLLIEKNKDFEKLNKESEILEWDLDIHISREHVHNAYFGELYWADTMPSVEFEDVYIPTGESIKSKRKRTFKDFLREGILDEESNSDEIEEITYNRLHFKSESTLMDYLWETNSETIKGFGEYFPSVRIGKNLRLAADPMTGKILDNDLKEAYKCIHYEDDKFFKNTFNYLRSDLLKKYMEENNLALVYQVKQHSYDENYLHNRKLKFFIVE